MAEKIEIADIDNIENEFEEDQKSCLIVQAFEDIGLMDPFPKVEGKQKKSDVSFQRIQKILGSISNMEESNLIYHEDHFDSYAPPRMIYVPSTNILRKMMRIQV